MSAAAEHAVREDCHSAHLFRPPLSQQDFHIVKLPLLEEEVRGPDALRQFSASLMQPYVSSSSDATAAASVAAGDNSLLGELQRQNEVLMKRVAELEAELQAARN